MKTRRAPWAQQAEPKFASPWPASTQGTAGSRAGCRHAPPLPAGLCHPIAFRFAAQRSPTALTARGRPEDQSCGGKQEARMGPAREGGQPGPGTAIRGESSHFIVQDWRWVEGKSHPLSF